MKAVQIPRSTCRLFGAIKSLGTLRRCVILVHGPKGCVYHINYILGMRGDRPSQVYSTCLEENDVIFGAEERLKEAIEELDRMESPDLIAVLSCCASSIIGEDVESAVRRARIHARVIGIEGGGFEGDFRQGYGETLRSLVDTLVEESGSIDPRSVNLVGVLRSGPDLRELTGILNRLGISVKAVLTAGATLSDIARMSSAALNIVLCEPSGLDAAKRLQEKFGTPYIIADLPIGAGATHRFVQRLSEALQIPIDSGFPETPHPLPPLTRRVALISGPTRAIAVTAFLKELGMEPALIVLDFDAGTRQRLQDMVGSEILVEPDQGLILKKLREKRVDLILGGMLERSFAAMLDIDFFDIMHGSQKTMGYEGVCNLLSVLGAEDVESNEKSPDQNCSF
ncbi:MAG: nitrogenase component 1 [Methanomicrobiales archaeon]|nr:nitrogenase component 1 [Methanomicrobiales archaeon]